MELSQSLLVIALAALIHASFQLSVSMLTLLSSHTIGAKHSHPRLVRLTNSFVFGAGVMTLLLLSATAFTVQQLVGTAADPIVWVGVCGLLFGLGIATWVFYYRHEQGTSLWIPREMARYLADRSKATKLSAEAFGLGLSSVLGELIFIAAPITVAALILVGLAPEWQLVGLGLYTVLSLGSLLIVNTLIGGGHRISRIQKWREDNKQFLQFAAGSGLLALGFYLYVEQILNQAVVAAAGVL